MQVEKTVVSKFDEYLLNEKIAEQIVSGFFQTNNETAIGRTISYIFNGKLAKTLETALSERIDDYVHMQGKEEIGNFFLLEVNKLLNSSSANLLSKVKWNIENIKPFLIMLYDKFITSCIDKILSTIQFNKIIEQQIKGLDMPEFEKMVLKIINKELRAIIIIGGVLGGLIGILNIFI